MGRSLTYTQLLRRNRPFRWLWSGQHHAGEILTWGLATALAGWSLQWLTPREVTVISGLVSGAAGLAWLALFITRSVRLPQRLKGGMAEQPAGAGD